MLRGAAGLLEETQVVPGSRVEWLDQKHNIRLISHLVNAIGLAGVPGVAAERQSELRETRAPQSALRKGTDTWQEREYLPPPPPWPAALDGSPQLHHPGQAKGSTLLEISSSTMTPDQLQTLHELAEER